MNKRTPDWLFSVPWRLGLAGILFLGLLAHVYAITTPIDDHHGWRQSQTAMIARNRSGERVVGAWLLGGVVYLLVMGRGNCYHDDDQIPVLPIACLYAGKGLSFLTERSFVQRGGLGFRPRQFAAVLLMGIAILQSKATLRW